MRLCGKDREQIQEHSVDGSMRKVRFFGMGMGSDTPWCLNCFVLGWNPEGEVLQGQCLASNSPRICSFIGYR